MPPKRNSKKRAAPQAAGAKKARGGKSKSQPSDVPAADSPSENLQISAEVESIMRGNDEDYLSFYGRKYWSTELQGEEKFDEKIVKEIFEKELIGVVNFARLNVLEASSYLENYLWNTFSSDSSWEHVFSIVQMINEKFREGHNTLDHITAEAGKFEDFFKMVIYMLPHQDKSLNAIQQASVVLFFINIFQSLENKVVRQCALPFLSLPIWQSLTSERLQMELNLNPQLRRHWEHFEESISAGSDTAQSTNVKGSGKRKQSRSTKKDVQSEKNADTNRNHSTWIPDLLKHFLSVMDRCESLQRNHSNEYVSWIYFLERCCELLIDLLSQLPTRRFLTTLLDDMHVIVRCKKSLLYSSSIEDGNLFIQLVDRIDSYIHFEINDQSGKALTLQDMMAANNSRLQKMQQVSHGCFPDSLKDVYFSSTGELGKVEKLKSCLSILSEDDLLTLSQKLGYISKNFQLLDNNASVSDFVIDVLIDQLAYRQDQSDSLNQTALIPDENLLWNPNLVPLGSKFNGNQVLCLPKLNLQFLTMHDYLLRNFSLFRLESAYEIRQDLQDSIKRMSPRQSLNGAVSFGGWARMALPIHSLTIEEVLKPSLGEVVPSRVSCSVEVDVSRFQGVIREEWESLREHDVVFLICIRNPQLEASKSANEFESERNRISRGQKPKSSRDFNWIEEDTSFREMFGVQFVRGGEIFEVRDEDDVILNDFTKPDERKSGRVGAKRRLRLHLDSAQYYKDMTEGVNCYETLNLLVRRKPKENNFRAILETIRELMNTAAIGRAVPTWLHDVFLGYGDPSAAHYRKMSSGTAKSLKDENDVACIEEADYTDTFLEASHVVESFPNADVSFQLESGEEVSLTKKDFSSTTLSQLYPPFKLKIQRGEDDASKDKVTVFPYKLRNMGPFPQDRKPTNTIRYTPAQVEALRSGMNDGLTMIVGPPGTGKTDVAVQIICNLYHNHPTQKILLVAHSNTALNDLFEKIMLRNVDPRHLLRLGSGEKSLGSRGKDAAGNEDIFSKQGRVNWSLARRLQLLGQVQYLAQSLGISGDVGYTCETAEYFQLEHIEPRMKNFYLELSQGNGDISSMFPFHKYFEAADQPLFKGLDVEIDKEIANGCFSHIENIFNELSDYRAFELLRTQGHRADYLLTKQARIVAMTCTHAAMTRKRLVQLGFKYDSLVMEEAAQVLEVETLIPMLLQDTDIVDGSRLKRVVLLGDHHQLPPVVQHPAFQKFSRLDQSLFSRFMRLSVPHVQLDKQGRARSEIADLYRWRYNELGNLPLVTEKEYCLANAGFAHTYQLINVPEFQGKGEHCPTPYFYQNLGEAEYVVAVYQFMRLIGYPADKISILTTYNGQKELIRDVISQRCKNKIFGFPSRVTTVDKFQGQQNDYVLLSLVRTESVGHLRDIRRLVVAASRAKLGLYVFGRQHLFENCQELYPTFSLLLKNPSVLQLVDGERFPCERRSQEVSMGSVIDVSDVTAMGVIVYQLTQRALSEAENSKTERNAKESFEDKDNVENDQMDVE